MNFKRDRLVHHDRSRDRRFVPRCTSVETHDIPPRTHNRSARRWKICFTMSKSRRDFICRDRAAKANLG
jgi:hypothetical protein